MSVSVRIDKKEDRDKKSQVGPREIAQWLKVFAAIAEDPGFGSRDPHDGL